MKWRYLDRGASLRSRATTERRNMMNKGSWARSWRVVMGAVPLAWGVVALAAEPRVVPVEEEIVEFSAQISNEGLTYDQYLAHMQDLHGRLLGELPDGALKTPVQIQLSDEDLATIGTRASLDEPLRVGVVKPVVPAITVTDRNLGLSVRDSKSPAGAVSRTNNDRGSIWTQAVTSAGAGGIRVHLTNFDLPQNAELFIFGLQGEAFGPYVGRGLNGDGDFWTDSILADTAVLQLRVSGPTAADDLRGLSMTISDVGHIGMQFVSQVVQVAASFCGNPDCIVDASCHNGTPADPSKNATAKMEWIAGPYIYTCSGGLIADNNPSQSNFFLTANHCISKNNNAQNVNFYWRFATSSCNGACPSNSGWPYKTIGSTVSKTGRRGDFTLLHLNSNPPSGSVFLGWTNAPVANTNGLDLFRISNPNFGPQVYSMHDVDTGAVTCSGWPRGERIYSNDAVGGIDGGSSGSVVVNASSQIVGQLSGTCGYNPGDPCDSASNSTVDGAFAYYFALVQPFLNP